MKLLLSLILVVALATTTTTRAETPQQRARELLSKMTLQDKLNMVYGVKGPYVGNVQPNAALNIPTLTLEDGPQGVADGTKQVTAWPCVLNVVATWDISLLEQYGRGMGEEQFAKGTNIMLGPMVNLYRVPVDGRSFESVGEDPVLGGEAAAAIIRGVQSTGVIATIKHWVVNNQEYNRTLTSAEVDERTLYELYYEAFKRGIEAGVGSVMCSYNLINGVYACENNATLNTALKGVLGFQGFVQSDWGATHSTVQAANNGLDMQMPDDSYFGAPLAAAVASGQVSQARVDDMVYRILLPMFTMGLFDRPQPTGNLSVPAQTAAHTRLAQTLAEQSVVLLKNDKMQVLPIRTDNIVKPITVAVIGDDASVNVIATGGGSGHVIPPYIVSPLEGIQNYVVGQQVNVLYADSSSIPQAIAVAKSADVVLFFVGVDSSEGRDRVNLSLPYPQDDLITQVVPYAQQSVVVINSPGAVLMPWVDSVNAIVWAGLPGQMYGDAIARVLFGDVNPSGKLPITFPMSESETPVATVQQYPGINNKAVYSEGLFIGYRWFDSQPKTPLFPFGFGLSYTTFTVGNLTGSVGPQAGTYVFTCVLTNTGKLPGAEVVQLYVAYPTTAGTPPKQLRGFEKRYLVPGESVTISFTVVAARDCIVWDTNSHSYQQVHGVFQALIGTSSIDQQLMSIAFKN